MSKTRILVVEDEVIIALDIQSQLQNLGYGVSGWASSGPDALKQAVETRPDLVLMDIGLQGDMDGIDTAQRLQARVGIPIVYLTAYADEVTLQRAKITSPYGYLLKPFEQRELHTTIEMALYRHQMERKLKDRERLHAALSRIQSRFIQEGDTFTRFQEMLQTMLELTDSESGFIGEILYTPGKHTCLKVYAINSLAWDASRRQFYRQKIADGFGFDNLENLFGKAIRTGQAVIINDLAGDLRWNMLPPEHMTITSFLGIPFQRGQDLIGMVGIANRPGGYDQDLIDWLEPVLSTCSSMITADHNERRRQQAEAALQESEARFRHAFDNAPIGMALVDCNQRFLQVNQALCTMLGYTKEELLDTTVAAISHPDDLKAETVHKQELVHGVSSSFTLEKRYLHADGHVVWGQLHVSIVTNSQDKPLYFVSQIEDVTGRKKAEAEIRRRNRDLTVLNRVITVSAATSEPKEILETACRELALTLDMPRASAALFNADESTKMTMASYLAEGLPNSIVPICQLISPADLGFLRQRQAPLVMHDEVPHPALMPLLELLHQRGTRSFLLLPLMVADQVLGCLGLEATQPHHFSAEEVNLAWQVAQQLAGVLARVHLAQTERRLITAIEQTSESVVITDTAGTILYVNPAFEETTGYNRAEIIGRNPRVLKSGKHNQVFYQEMWATISSGQVWHGRLVNRKKDGNLISEDATITPVRDTRGEIVNYVEVKRDVTRELELEEQYRQAQKMEAIGLLAGGIAHDFNNVLTAINGYSALLQAEIPPDSPAHEQLQIIFRSGRRAAELVRQLLAFSRKQIVEPEILDLNYTICEIKKMLQRIIPEHIIIETDLAENLWPIKIDPSQLEQIILNLAINARDAMPNGGRLTIQTVNMTLDEGYANHHLAMEPGDYVGLAVGDTGIGMSKEIQVRIFEPFFTTKELGRGTGLGLATVYGIVKQNGGSVWVYSEQEIGSTFKIYLPRANQKAPAAHPPDEKRELPRGTETILLVEDEPAVRDLATFVLREQGYFVLAASHGHEALQLAQEHLQDIQLLLTDVIMPGMNGKDLARQLSQVRPDLKIIFMSGYTDGTIGRHGVLDPGNVFIQKPFLPRMLVHKIREVLDGGGSVHGPDQDYGR